MISLLMGVYILYEDKKFDNLLESVVKFESDNPKYNNSSVLNKSLLTKNTDHYDLNDEEKKLLHISRLI